MASNSRTIEFCSYLAYAPNGKSEFSIKSNQIIEKIKQNRSAILQKIVTDMSRHIKSDPTGILGTFFNDSYTLIPVPKSYPIKDPNTLKVPEIICEELVKNGLAKDIVNCITRIERVRKSAYSQRGNRPTPLEHYKSIELEQGIFLPKKVILVDDVITLGATIGGCADLIRQSYPNIEVKSFSLVRTKGYADFDSISQIRNPYLGLIKYNDEKADRDD